MFLNNYYIYGKKSKVVNFNRSSKKFPKNNLKTADTRINTLNENEIPTEYNVRII